MKNLLRKYAFLLIVSGLIIAFDQYTKALVRSHLAIGEMWAPWDWLYPYARIVHWWNTGVAFGMLQGMNTIFAILAVVVSLAILYYFPRVPAHETLLRLALSMQVGGAVGNLIDRVTVGHVTDFISVGRFAVFNIADASISVGVGVLILGVWLQEKRQQRDAAQAIHERALSEREDPPQNELAPNDHEAA